MLRLHEVNYVLRELTASKAFSKNNGNMCDLKFNEIDDGTEQINEKTSCSKTYEIRTLVINNKINFRTYKLYH